VSGLNHQRFSNPEHGFTLVELMISVVLGLILIGGLVTAFYGTKRSSDLNITLTEMQESGRFALDSIIRDVRMAGFQGCANVSDMPAQVRADAAPTDDYLADSLQGHVVEGPANWVPAPHANFNFPADAGSPVPGTHALTVQFGSTTTYEIEPMTTTAAAVTVIGDNMDIVAGDLALISDCNGADIFEVTSNSGNVLQHAAANNGGDNRLSAPYGQGDPRNRPRIMRFEANIYYIGDTGRTNGEGAPVRSLYRQTLPYTSPPIEMAEGVESFRVRLGVEDPENPGQVTYVSPDNALVAAQQIKSVQVGFLMQSYDSVADSDDGRTYQIAGYNILAAATAADGSVHAIDRKMRLAFNGSVAVRNR